MATPKTTRSHHRTASEREQLRAFEDGVVHANPEVFSAETSASGSASNTRKRHAGGRPRKDANDYEVMDAGSSENTAPIAGRDLDRIYTLTGGAGKKRRVEGSSIARSRVFRSTRRPVRTSVLEEWTAWQPFGGDMYAEDVDGDDWEEVVEDTAPSNALDENGEEAVPSEDKALPSQPPKRYTSSDDPMAVWLALRQDFLEESLRREGLERSASCCSCKKPFSATANVASQPLGAGAGSETVDLLVRCETCGSFTECVQCCLVRHARSPLHVIKTFGSTGFWERSSLSSLGLTVHIGHKGGHCAHPAPVRTMTVMHTNGIHRIRAAFCDCDLCDGVDTWRQAFRDGWYPATTKQPQTFATVELLDFYRVLNVVANVNVRNFVTSLERKSNPHGTEWVPDRYKSFSLMSRQWSYLKRLRRSGIGHTKEGIAGAQWGSTAVRCWACPWEGVNLPDDWRNAKPEERFLYMLFLALDANFRMRSRLRKKSARKGYVILGDGLGYQVPADSYHEHLRGYVSEEDISTCIAFAALMQKDSRLSTGLRATGIGGCICARHELVRPLGIGDLMKGERYANMDYIFWAAIIGVLLMYVMLSYDVGCQWKVNLQQRKSLLPSVLQHDSASGHPAPIVRVGLPVWHGGVHQESCSTENSLRYKTGAAMTDGEGVERVWSDFNPKSMALKEMHEDGRHENLEEAIDAHNFDKCMGLGVLLHRRLEVATEERDEQIKAHKEATKSLGRDVKEDWSGRLHAWHAEEDLPSAARKAPNPYVSEWDKTSLSKENIQQQLDAEEAEDKRLEQDAADAAHRPQTTTGKRGSSSKKKATRMSASAFLCIGLRLEEVQLRIRCVQKQRVNLSGPQDAKVQERRKSLWQQLEGFRTVQVSFMPVVSALLREESEARDTSAGPVNVEDINLWLPSAIPVGRRGSGCRASLLKMEAILRRAQCHDNLVRLRLRLHAKNHLIRFRNEHLTGQKRTTRARTLINSVSDRIDIIVAKYRTAQVALTRLQSVDGIEGPGEYQVLQDADISSRFVEDYNAKAARRLARISGRESRLAPAAADKDAVDDEDTGAEARGHSRRKLSWIWTAAGAPDATSDEYLHESIRIEWSKSWARKKRWSEEVSLLKVEMGRVLVTLAFLADAWSRRAKEAEGHDEVLVGGRRAYALRQVAWLQRVRQKFGERWTVPADGIGGEKRSHPENDP